MLTLIIGIIVIFGGVSENALAASLIWDVILLLIIASLTLKIEVVKK